MNWKSKRVLVTGAGGFIGSHLAERLVQLGATTRAMVHYNALGTRGWLDQSTMAADMEIVAGDITDRDSVAGALRDVDTVFHLAALIGIPYSYHAPASYVRTNIEGTLNVLQGARERGVRRVVHTSTSEVYGTAKYVPIDEKHPLQGQSPYSATKIGADKLAESFHLAFGVPVVTVRPFNTYGPRQSARAVIPSIVTQLLAGSRVKLGNLTPSRDLNFVSDTAEGFLCAALSEEAVGQTFNLGTGREISIGALAKLLAEMTGRDLAMDTEGVRVRPTGSEVERLLADNTKARTILGWQPATTLEEGLARTIVWLRDHLAVYRPGTYAC
jgi:dTDP-glucose 4,6-dehydratase